MMVVGMMVGCTSPRPSPGGEGGGLTRDGDNDSSGNPHTYLEGEKLPRPLGTPSERGTDSVVLDEEYYRRMWLFEAVGAGEVELDK